MLQECIVEQVTSELLTFREECGVVDVLLNSFRSSLEAAELSLQQETRLVERKKALATMKASDDGHMSLDVELGLHVRAGQTLGYLAV